ncbi:MAG: hypothetical protein QM831_36635 [Kofleriaceae bacterium]
MLLPGPVAWNAANWVERAFFDDALEILPAESPLRAKIELCVAAQIDSLDLEAAPKADVAALATLIDEVIDWTTAESFADPAQWPVYVRKLEELRELVRCQVVPPP